MKNHQKNALTLLLSFSLLFLMSCSKDDESDGPSYDFVNQNAQGTIDGISFTFAAGTAEKSNDGEDLSVDFYDITEELTDVCDFFGLGESVTVFFTIPNAVGLYELSFDLSSFDGRTVTLFNPDTFLNIISSEGAVEILSITETQVTGRIDARADDSFVNGNFTLEICE
ncbi:MAG: hypothetical protein ABJP45_13755 [Cyclobacteriaceae bacterium]